MDSQTSLFSNFFIKNESHDIIHIFKNYFVIVFSVFCFSKISSISLGYDGSFLPLSFNLEANV